MKRKHTLRSLLSMVCTIAMIISMVPVLPAAAAEGDLLFDNMESYTVGTDLYSQAGDKYTQKSPSWNAVKDAGGSATVVADPKDSKNKVIAVSTPGGDSKRYVLATAPELNGDYTVQFDYMPGDAEGNPNSGFMDVYVNSGNAHTARIASGLYNTYFNLDKTGCSNVIKNAELDMKNQWYSVRIVVTAGQYVMDIWEKGDEDTMLTCTTTKGTKAVSKAHVEFCIGPYLESQKVGDTDKPITNYIDNIRITPGVVEATDPSEDAGDVAVAGGGMIEFVDEYIIENKDAVAVTAGMGIFSGKDGNRFDPMGQLTRAEMATVIVKMLRGNAFNADNFKGADTFPDTADYQGGWAEGYINACVQMGIVKGYGDGTFKPGNPVNTAEALTMIINALKVDAGEGSWPETIMAKAQDMKLYGDLAAKPNTYDVLTRDQLAVLVYEGMCYSPSGASGWKVDGRDTIFTSYADAKAFGDPIEVNGEDSLASKIYEMQIVEGYIVANQDTSDNKYTTIQTVKNGALGVEMKFNMKTALDRIGHYVTVYYREDWNGEQDPGVVYNYVDKTEVITVEKDLTSKDYKDVFYEKYKPASKVAHFNGDYTWGDNYASLNTSKYVAGTKAVAGFYFIYEGEIVGYMAPVPVYAAKVEAVNDYADSETIELSGVSAPIENNEEKDYIREYKGIAEDDYVTYTKVGNGETAIYVLTKAIEVKGTVTKQTTKDENDVITVGGVEFVQFDGPGSTYEENQISKFVTDGVTTKFEDSSWNGTYIFYLTEDGKYIGFEEAEGNLGMDQTVFILGQVEIDTKDKYSQSIRKTYARGVDMSGNEVMLLLMVQKNGSVLPSGVFKPSLNTADNTYDSSYEERFNFKLTEKTFYTYELSTETEAKKEGVYKLEAYPTTYDKETAPIYSASSNVAAGKVVGFNGYSFGSPSMLTYASSGVIFMTVDGNKDQDTALTGSLQKLWSTTTNTTGGTMERYFLLSRGEDGNQLFEAIVILTENAKGANTVVYVSADSLANAGTSAEGAVYTVHDYQTGAKKEVTLSFASSRFDSVGYWHLAAEEDTSCYLVEGKVTDPAAFNYNASAGSDADGLYNENILHNQVMTALVNNQLSTAYVTSPSEVIMTRGQKADSAVVMDLRTEDQIKSDGMGKINSLARINTLALNNPEITVVFDLCYSLGSDKMLTLFVKELKFSSTEDTKITQSGGTYSVDGRPVADDVVITDVSGRMEADIDMADLIAKMEESNVTFEYEIENGKITAITVTGVLEEGELFFVGFDNYEDGEEYTDSVVEGTSAAKYTSVTTETIGDVKALQVTANGTSSEVLNAGPSVAGNYVWETRVNMLDANGYTVLYTTALKTRTAADKTFANFQLQVNSAGYVTMYRNTAGGGSTKIADVPRADWVVIRVTVTNIAGTTANDSILIEVFDKTGTTKLGELYQAGDDYVSVGTTSRIGFDIRGSAGDHKFAIDYIKVTEGEANVEATTYTATPAQVNEGLIVLSKTTGITEGEEITVTAYPEAGYKLSSLKVNGGVNLVDGTDLSDTVIVKFDMPAANATVTPEFVAIQGSKVTVTNPAEGTITVTGADDLTNVIEGTVLTISATATDSARYALKAITVNGDEIEEEDGAYTYTVPATGADLEITAEFDTLYTVTTGTVANGTLRVDKEGAVAGATVTITATPAAYYKAGAITVTMASGGTVAVTENKFIMPEDDVTVTTTFTPMTYTLTTKVNDADFGTVTAGGTKNAGETVTITLTPKTDYVAKHVLVNGVKKDLTGTNTYDLVVTDETATTVTAVFWPEGAAFYEGFDYAVGDFALGGTSTMKKGSNYGGNVTHKIVNEGELTVTATGGSGNRGVVAVNKNFNGSYTVEARIKANPGAGQYTMVYLNNVKFPRYNNSTYSTIKYDLRFAQASNTPWLELNKPVAAGANANSVKGNKITGGVDGTGSRMYLYANGNPNNVVTDTSAVTYSTNTWYTLKIMVDATNKTVTTELWNSNGTTKLGSRTLYDAIIANGTFEIECFYNSTTVIDYITIYQD